jgi:hypothetical protein
MVGLAQEDIGNHLQLMVGSDHKNIFLYLGEWEKKIEVKEVEESKEILDWLWKSAISN